MPARDKVAAARWFATIFGLNFNEQEGDHFAPVQVNETLTLLFDQDTSFDSHHYPGASMTASSMIGMTAVAIISRTRTVTSLS